MPVERRQHAPFSGSGLSIPSPLFAHIGQFIQQLPLVGFDLIVVAIFHLLAELFEDANTFLRLLQLKATLFHDSTDLFQLLAQLLSEPVEHCVERLAANHLLDRDSRCGEPLTSFQKFLTAHLVELGNLVFDSLLILRRFGKRQPSLLSSAISQTLESIQAELKPLQTTNSSRPANAKRPEVPLGPGAAAIRSGKPTVGSRGIRDPRRSWR